MKTTTLIVAATFLALAVIVAPGEWAPTGTAAAEFCEPNVKDLEGYVECQERQCDWSQFPRGPVVCTD